MERQQERAASRWVRSALNWWVCLAGAWTGNVIMDGPTSYRAYLIRWHSGLIAEEIRSTVLYAIREEAQAWCAAALAGLQEY